MMFAISDETWEKLIFALIPLIVAITAWLRGEYKDWQIDRAAKAAKETAERAETKTDALQGELFDKGAVESKPAPPPVPPK